MSTSKNHYFDFPAPGAGGTFADRLEWMLDGRKLTPWAKGIGMGGGSIDAMRGPGGRPPSHEYLTRIRHVENVSISWLLGARVPPFLRIVTNTDAETAEALTAHLQDEAWSVALFTDGEATAWLLHQEGALDNEKGEIRYRIITVIVGPSGAETARTLANHGHRVLQHIQQLSAEQLRAIGRGQVGTWRFFGDDKTPGLWNQSTATTGMTLDDAMPGERLAVGEPPPVPYNAMPAPARAIVDVWQQLPQDRRSALELVVAGLVTPIVPADQS